MTKNLRGQFTKEVKRTKERAKTRGINIGFALGIIAAGLLALIWLS